MRVVGVGNCGIIRLGEWGIVGLLKGVVGGLGERGIAGLR